VIRSAVTVARLINCAGCRRPITFTPRWAPELVQHQLSTVKSLVESNTTSNAR